MSVRNNAVGVLHPGEMGSVAALTLQNAGHRVYWVAEGRSAHSRRRAEELGLCDAGSLAHLCEMCSEVVSVCPPEFADDVVDSVLQHGFNGLYIDANAISPKRAEGMARRVIEAGAEFVDACIIGHASRVSGAPESRLESRLRLGLAAPLQPWIYISGAQAERAAGLFGTGGPLQPEAIGERIGQASALKMCYVGFSKGSRALLVAVVAAAEQLGVRDLLERQWERSDRELTEAEKTMARVAAKAWRFAPEMQEIASAFEAAGIGGDFHRAAAKLYARLAPFKDAESPDIEEILSACAMLEKIPRQERTA